MPKVKATRRLWKEVGMFTEEELSTIEYALNTVIVGIETAEFNAFELTCQREELHKLLEKVRKM